MDMREGTADAGLPTEPSEKPCPKCRIAKPLAEFHRSSSAKNGRASWCRTFANGIHRDYRSRNYCKEKKRRWALKSRYGITPEYVASKLEEQGGVCAICKGEMKRKCIDHNHATGAVRGILCHRCNVRLASCEETHWHGEAIRYLERYK